MEALLSFFMHVCISSFHLSWVELYGSPKVHRLARDSDKHRLCIRWRRRRQPPRHALAFLSLQPGIKGNRPNVTQSPNSTTKKA